MFEIKIFLYICIYFQFLNLMKINVDKQDLQILMQNSKDLKFSYLRYLINKIL